MTTVDAIDLVVPAGTCCCLLGPSGCGKSSTLRMIAGHESVTLGDILLGAANVTDLAPGGRPARVTKVEYQGAWIQANLATDDGTELVALVLEAACDAAPFQTGDRVAVRWDQAAAHSLS